MRIVYLHQYFNTLGMVGGTRSYEMARRLVAMGHVVHMVTSQRESDAGKSRGWFRTEEDGIHVHWLPVPYSNHMDYGERLRSFAHFAWSAGSKAASLDGDVIFATSSPLTIALPGIRASRACRIPMVLEVRDLWPEVAIAMGALRSRASIAAAHWLERFAYRHATQIVALSPGMKAGIVATGFPAERVTVLPNACDVELFDVGPEPGRALRLRHAWLGDRPLIVYTGALGHVNGVGYLARLAAAVGAIDPRVCFVIIGAGREEQLVRRTATQSGVLDRNFFMLPSVPKSEIPAWLSAADIATSTVIDRQALWANSANKVFDAFAAAKPVAINHEGWMADLLRETEAGLVLDAHDIAAAAAAVVAALRDSRWLSRAGDSARQLAAERFNRDRLASELEQVLLRAAWVRSAAGETPALATVGSSMPSPSSAAHAYDV